MKQTQKLQSQEETTSSLKKQLKEELEIYRELKTYVDRSRRSNRFPKYKYDSATKSVIPELELGKHLPALSSAFGTADMDLINRLLDEVALAIGYRNGEKDIDRLNSALSTLAAIKPKDELEGMLAVQMLGIHHLAMKNLGWASVDGQYDEARIKCTAQANQLIKTFTLQMEALGKYRGKGQQKVTVKHVHVHDGGQAIVGSVKQVKDRGPLGEVE